jgi:TRAP transporter TAXI family solute receptor
VSFSPRSISALPRRRRRRGRWALTVWIWITAFCLAALLATYMLFVEPPPPHKIVIASGARNGAYFHYAEKYAEELKNDKLAIEIRETAGSVENLRLLGEPGSDVSVAIVQSGVASPADLDRLYALGSLYREPLWVFHRTATRLDRLSQLAGKRIGVGPPGSGTQAIAKQMLAANGLGETKSAGEGPPAVLVEANTSAAANALCNGELDAAFFVAAFDAEYIQRLLNDNRVSLLGFDQHEAYHRRFRFLAPVTVPAGLVTLGRNVPAVDVSVLASSQTQANFLPKSSVTYP